MNQTNAIAASVTGLWRTNAALTTLVPGGLLYGILKPAARPYAELKVTMQGGPRFQSGPTYLQTYVVDIMVWAANALASAAAIQDALESLLGTQTKLVMDGNAVTLAIMIDPAGIDEEAQRSAKGGIGQNVFIAGARWRVQCAEDRHLGAAGTL